MRPKFQYYPKSASASPPLTGVSSQKKAINRDIPSLPIQINRIMYSSEDLERFYFQYQSEALPHGESLQSFCVKNKVPS